MKIACLGSLTSFSVKKDTCTILDIIKYIFQKCYQYVLHLLTYGWLVSVRSFKYMYPGLLQCSRRLPVVPGCKMLRASSLLSPRNTGSQFHATTEKNKFNLLTWETKKHTS